MINEVFSDENDVLENDSEIEYDVNAISSEPYSEYDDKRSCCAFTGHRNITSEEKARLLPKLKSTVLYLISIGVKKFHCGGALGFDTLAASVVFDVSRYHEGVELILDIPFENQSERWTADEKRIYEFLKSKAHRIEIHSPNPKNSNEATKFLLKRNRIMVDKSYYCVCYLRNEKAVRGGTAYTVKYATKNDLQIINLAESHS